MHQTHSPIDSPPFARVEDHRLLAGGASYVQDMALPDMLHAVFVRSVHAHASIASIDVSAAMQVEGLVGVWSGVDLQGCTVPLHNPLLEGTQAVSMPLLPTTEIDYVGQPLALVVARSADAARRGADAVWIDCSALPPWRDHDAEAPVVAAVAHRTGTAPDGAAHVVKVTHVQPRVVAMALEPRGIVARWNSATGCLDAWISTQTPWRARDDLARMLGLEKSQVRVVAPDVGGAFGAKSSLGPEELAVAWVARSTGRAIKWTASRTEEFTAGMQGRGMRLEGELSLDSQGRFTHLRARLQATTGAWLPFSAVVPARNAARILPGPYNAGSVDIAAQVRRSHAAPVTIYRGAGRPEAALLMERLVERAARRIGIDPLELRRRNLIGRAELPYRTPTGEVLDAGDYRAALDAAAAQFDYSSERALQVSRRAAGEVVGIGAALYIEPCGQGCESARVTMLSDGSVEVASGSSAQGQGHETSYASIAAGALGCDPASVQVRHGDTSHGPEGIGALASRSMAIGGSAVLLASQEVQRRRDAGEPFPLSAEQVYHAPAEAWSYGCVMVRLAIDRETGRPRIERIVWADDAGHIVSPQLAHGQLLGGLAQGLGQALLERIVYDAEGQIVTGSLMDYAVPRADDMPPVELRSLHVESAANALGAKGVGEVGCIGVPAAVLNAAADALSPFREVELDFPLTAESLWRAMQSD